MGTRRNCRCICKSEAPGFSVRDMSGTQAINFASAEAAAAPSRSKIVENLEMCPLCSGNSFRHLPTPTKWIGRDIFSVGSGEFGLRRCRNCSLSFVNPRPTWALLNAFYDSNSYVCHKPESGNTTTADFLMQCVVRHGPYQGKHFLDFGCGGGFLLQAATTHGWNAVGYDVGQRALAACKAQRLNARGNFEDFRPHSFDVLFLNHVFEHIAQPQDVLNLCRRVLKKKGKLFVVVPNLAGLRARLALPALSQRFQVDERHRAFPIHLFYYTPRTLSRILEKNDFRVTAVETFGFGMDEFIHRGPANGAAKVGGATAAGVKTESGFKQVLKKRFFNAGLGENLLVGANPA